eukprot:1191027-Prorocentrum_minimum.AAC.1
MWTSTANEDRIFDSTQSGNPKAESRNSPGPVLDFLCLRVCQGVKTRSSADCSGGSQRTLQASQLRTDG